MENSLPRFQYRVSKNREAFIFIYFLVKQIKMKKIKLSLLFTAALCMFLSCSKREEEAETCEDTHTTKVTFSNTTNAALRVVVSTRLTPQFVPIEPIFTLDLAPGQSVVKEFMAGRYINSWYNGCPSNCNRMGNIFRDFDSCIEYEEKQ